MKICTTKQWKNLGSKRLSDTLHLYTERVTAMTMQTVNFLDCARTEAEREMLVLLRDLHLAAKQMRARLEGLTAQLEEAHAMPVAA